jgi:hypothetical protein
MQIGDTSNGPVSVKPASTAALQADLALVTRNPDIGTPTDSACGTATGNCSLIALQKYSNNSNVTLSQGGSVLSATTGLYANTLQGNAALSATNGGYQNILQGNVALGATNGLYSNLLQGNAVLSATNGLYANLMVGNAAVATGTGAQGATVPRVTVATDTATVAGSASIPAGTNLMGKVGIDQTTPGTTNAVAATNLPTTVDTNAGNAGASTLRVVLASNQTAADPCMFQAKTNVPISTASGTTAVVTGVSAKKIYVCSLSLIANAAVAVSLSEGSSSTCGTSAQAAVLGVATNGTAANGLSLAANGGLTLGNGGGTVAATATNANYLCLFQSGTVQIAGNLTYVQQ